MTITNGQLTGLSSAQVLTVPAGASAVLLQAETQNIRYTADGQTPTSSLGLILIVGNDPVRFSGNLAALKFLEVAATAKLNYQFHIDRVLI
jgi:hypothetical protein